MYTDLWPRAYGHSTVYALALDGERLFVGGDFVFIPGRGRSRQYAAALAGDGR